MKQTSSKKALKSYQNAGGNYCTKINIPIRKESDLEYFYYPGINAVLEKIGKDKNNQRKYCSYHKTIGLISTKSEEYYPLLTAKAALLSHVTGLNTIPLMLRYEKYNYLPDLLRRISPSFQAMFFTDLSLSEKIVIEKMTSDIPILFHDDMEAAAVVAAIMNASKMRKKSLKKVSITIEGVDRYIYQVVKQLIGEKAESITLVDKKGVLYMRRPNMNKEKNELVKLLKLGKDERTRAEVLASTDIYVNSGPEDLSSKVTDMLPSKAVIITLKSEKVEKRAKQALVSTIPTRPNHITDLHITAGIALAIAEGRKYGPKTLSQATQALASIYKGPKIDKIVPGLLEKNLAKKIAKGIK